MLEHLLHHFHFTWSIPESSQLLPVTYNFWLVVVSYVIALLAGYTGFSVSQLAKAQSDNQQSSHKLILAGSIVMGVGIWAMHFIAMLAYSIGEPIHYNAAITLVSVFPACIASYATLKAISKLTFNGKQKVLYGLIIGLGIGVMHYIGMAAMYHDARSVYHVGYFVASVVVAWVLGVVTLNLRTSAYLESILPTRWLMLVSAALWALAVCAMHYTGMYAIFYMPGAGVEVTEGISSQSLIWPVSIASFLLIIVTLGFLSIQKRLLIASAEATYNKERLLEAIEEMSDGFLLSSESGDTIMVNQNLSRVLPGAENFTNRKVQEFIHWLLDTQSLSSLKDDKRNEFKQVLLLHSSLPSPLEFQLQDERWIQVKQSQTRSGATMRMFSDITERKKTQDAMFEEDKMGSLSRMVAGVAHEVNTPLGICLTLSSQFEAETQNITHTYENAEVSQEQFEGYLHNMARISDLLLTNIRRAANLISSFKQVAVDQSILEVETIQLKPYTEKIFTALKSEYKRFNPVIEINCDEEFKFETLPGAYSQVIMNLVKNSALHAFEGIDEPKMTIDVKPDKENVHIVYRDNGVGMTEETLQKVFEPFYTTKRQKGGTGLGMHIVFNLITQKLKGKIRVESHQGQGSAFYFTLPLSLQSVSA
ncbi:PAS-domain containing protein [Paraneptunicella aestuarii]|uniref:MHYT domain-containing protein n=1 Tax=Paraneptunicella aestuarii TaxID=2831148 RepID=UPI001E5BCD14|nr:MHYT domain-containing protein [Paraneptunicella aestuarii]UAA39922.1 PAS-domain containing protein [Paraneptunicella aestuarii]